MAGAQVVAVRFDAGREGADDDHRVGVVVVQGRQGARATGDLAADPYVHLDDDPTEPPVGVGPRVRCGDRRKPRLVTPVDRGRGGPATAAAPLQRSPVRTSRRCVTRAEAFDGSSATPRTTCSGCGRTNCRAWSSRSRTCRDRPGVPESMPRWRVEHDERRVTVYRIPVERLARSPEKDDVERRIVVETAVFRRSPSCSTRTPGTWRPTATATGEPRRALDAAPARACGA